MQGACDEFLPGAALAINEYAAVGGSGDGNLLAQGFHGDAVADDLEALAELAAQYQVLLLKAALLDGIADEDDDFFEESGFSMKSKAPSFVARTAASMLPWPEIMMTAGASECCGCG